LGAVVRPEPSRDRVSTILERQGFNIHGISEQDLREILAEVERASNRMLAAIEDNTTMVEVGNG